ncbi:MAG: hypothetical protein SOY42_03170 [Clostridium sp.]|nr:hypothetical protein [Clostridium sp.]
MDKGLLINDKYKTNKMIAIVILIPLTIICKILQFTVLPDKYFYDSARMLSMSTGSNSMQAWGDAYEVVADLFRALNILNFTTLQEWAYSLAFIFGIVLILMLSRIDEPDNLQLFFIICSIGLLNIYIFNISKDVIQYGIFFLMYLVIINKRIPKLLKIVGAFFIFYWESTFFRSYYILMGALFIILYGVIKVIQKRDKPINRNELIGVFSIIFIVMFLLVYFSQFISYEDYQRLINVRYDVPNPGAVSAINNLIDDRGNLALYMVNYVINAVRMMLPVELLLNGPFYAPFVIYQIMILYYLVLTIKSLNKNTNEIVVLALSAFLGYLLVSFTFEPDFGSFVRHEAATFPILHLMALRKENYRLNFKGVKKLEAKNI